MGVIEGKDPSFVKGLKPQAKQPDQWKKRGATKGKTAVYISRENGKTSQRQPAVAPHTTQKKSRGVLPFP